MQVKFHPEIRNLVFDVLFNIALRMNLGFDEVRDMAGLARQWGGGVVGDPIDASEKSKAAYDAGMKARYARCLGASSAFTKAPHDP